MRTGHGEPRIGVRLAIEVTDLPGLLSSDQPCLDSRVRAQAEPGTNKSTVAVPPKHAARPPSNLSAEEQEEMHAAAEANELLELRSMGIRARIRAAPSAPGFSMYSF